MYRTKLKLGNAMARAMFGHGIFEHLVPDGPEVRVRLKGCPEYGEMRLTIDENGQVVAEMILPDIHWDEDTLQ